MELDVAQALLRKVVGSSGDGVHDGHAPAQAGGAADNGDSGSGCCSGGGGHDHSHAHAHHGRHAHGGSDERAGPKCGDAHRGSGEGVVSDKPAEGGVRGALRGEEEEGAKKEMVGVLDVLRRAKTACRVAEGACLLRGGRVAESTETLRRLLFEVLYINCFG